MPRPPGLGGGPAVAAERLEGLARTPGGTSVFGFRPVVPMLLASALLMFAASSLTPKPSPATIARYFPRG